MLLKIYITAEVINRDYRTADRSAAAQFTAVPIAPDEASCIPNSILSVDSGWRISMNSGSSR